MITNISNYAVLSDNTADVIISEETLRKFPQTTSSEEDNTSSIVLYKAVIHGNQGVYYAGRRFEGTIHGWGGSKEEALMAALNNLADLYNRRGENK